MGMTRREIIAGAAAGLMGARLAAAQQTQAAAVPVRKGKIVKLFKTQEGFPNALAASPEGWWGGEQKTQHACLLGWDGKVLKTTPTESKNTSGIAYGGGSVWMCANAEPNGIHQIDLKTGASTHRQ